MGGFSLESPLRKKCKTISHRVLQKTLGANLPALQSLLYQTIEAAFEEELAGKVVDGKVTHRALKSLSVGKYNLH